MGLEANFCSKFTRKNFPEVLTLGVIVAVSTTMLSLPQPALPQSSPAPLQSQGIEPDLGGSRPDLPDLEAAPEPDFELPTVPTPGERKRRLSSGVKVMVKAVRFNGNEVFSDDQLARVTAPYTGRAITTEELLEMSDALTRFYIDKGYVNSGAVIPDQDVGDGVIEVTLVEGRLSDIAIGGLEHLDQNYVEDRIGLGAGPPLNVNRLRDEIQLLLVDPSVAQVVGRLGPGQRPGDGVLSLDVTEAPPQAFTLRFANDRAPSVGAEHGEVTYRVGNVLGRSDPLQFRLGLSEGLRDADLSYSVPLTPSDFRFFLFGALTDSEVVEEPFNQIDVESESEALQLGFSYPVIRTVDNELRFELIGERKKSQTFLLGNPFPFSAGVGSNGRSVVTALRAVQNWQIRTRDQVIALRSTESLGVDALGATVNGAGSIPDGKFFSWLAQAQFAQRLFDTDWQLNLRGDVQLTPDPLLAIERIAIGGGDTVRGYRENQLVLDNGWVASAEVRIPIGSLRVPYISTGIDDGALQFVPFVDAGGGYNIDAPEPEDDFLLSIGGGLRWQINPATNLRFDVGVPLRDVPDPSDDDLQDLGIHFEISTRLY